MPRKYKKKGTLNTYTKVQFDQVKEALKTKSQRVVSKEFKIPKSTIADWAKFPKFVKIGSTVALSADDENLLVEALNFTAACGFPQSRDQLKDMVQSYVQSTGKVTPFKDGRPGPDWTLSFERRHKPVLRRKKKEPLSKARARGMTQENVDKFYDMFEDVLKEHGIADKPWLLFNLDESALTGETNDQMVYVGAGVKNAYSITPMGTRAMFTVLFCCNAVGQYLPPYTIFKAKHLYESWTTGGVEGASYSVSDSGWMHDKNFENWFTTIFVPYTRSMCGGFTCVLVYDGHNSHITYQTVRAAIDNNVVIV